MFMFIKMVEEVNLIGWKGKDAIEIEEGTASEKYTSRYLAKKLIQREYGTIKTKYATKRVQS